MMKIQMVAFCLAAQICCMSQSPELFKGGAGDGLANRSYIQNSVAFWLGGPADGSALKGYAQSSTAFWLGGSGDGFVRSSYQQTSTSFWLGGTGDGSVKSGYQQAATSFWLGGMGDGFAKTSYTQPSVGFWLGGPGDGHADSSFMQQSQAFWLGGTGDGWASTYIPNRALPVTLTSFTALKKSPSEALLNWTTQSETNSSHFDIERSSDAVNFYYLHTAKAAGHSSLQKDYAFTDNRVLPGNNYYRLKQVDKDGKFVYTPTRMVTFTAATTGNFSMYPNPATTYVMIELQGNMASKKTIINMMDMKGNVVKQWKMDTIFPAPSRLSFQGLPKGTYLIHIINEQSSTFQKLIVQ